MGATNVPWQLDPAMMRPGRFDEKIYIPLPDRAAMLKLLEINLGKRPLAPDVDFEALAVELDGYSGADVRYICDRAAVVPFMRAVARSAEGAEAGEEPITMAILRDVISDTQRSVTRQMLERFEEFSAKETA
jgi:transitional endoplasmic reticulum ATPase